MGGLCASNKLKSKADPEKKTLYDQGRRVQSSGVVSQNDLSNIDAGEELTLIRMKSLRISGMPKFRIWASGRMKTLMVRGLSQLKY